jgi:hypothetical protein
MSFNPWFEIDPATLVTKERSLARFLSQFSWDGMYDWLQVRLPNNIQNSCQHFRLSCFNFFLNALV